MWNREVASTPAPPAQAASAAVAAAAVLPAEDSLSIENA